MLIVQIQHLVFQAAHAFKIMNLVTTGFHAPLLTHAIPTTADVARIRSVHMQVLVPPYVHAIMDIHHNLGFKMTALRQTTANIATEGVR